MSRTGEEGRNASANLSITFGRIHNVPTDVRDLKLQVVLYFEDFMLLSRIIDGAQLRGGALEFSDQQYPFIIPKKAFPVRAKFELTYRDKVQSYANPVARLEAQLTLADKIDSVRNKKQLRVTFDNTASIDFEAQIRHVPAKQGLSSLLPNIFEKKPNGSKASVADTDSQIVAERNKNLSP